MTHKKKKKIVLTGGPCGGKTTLSRFLAKAFERNLVVVPESASLLFSGGFPRWHDYECIKSTQRAIYQVQCELELSFTTHFSEFNLILDRGTLDGAAYWPDGAESYFINVGTTLEQETARYDRVIYLESADEKAYEENKKRNPNRHETWEEAHKLDELTFALWSKHPRLTVVRNQCSFSEKVSNVFELIEEELGLKSPK
jgi:predicted ATPase